MKCALDCSGWRISPENLDRDLETLEGVLDILDQAQGCDIYYSDDLFNREIYNNLSFFELYSEDSAVCIPHNIQERVSAVFLRMQRWEDTGIWPDDTDVLIGSGNGKFMPCVAWAHKIARQKPIEPVGLILISDNIASGTLEVKVAGDSENMYVMRESFDWQLFNRYVIRSLTSKSSEMTKYARDAFPNLRFLESCLDGIHSMSRPYNAIIDDVVRHLSAFSDHGRHIFAQRSQIIPSLFGPHGVDISDENGNTKASRESKRQRTRVFEGDEIVFWWHSKIDRDRDRIHIYFDSRDSEIRIIIGILCRHLD